MLKHLSLPLLLCIPAVAQADNLRVVVDIPPLHSLTTQVMGETGTPELLTKPGTSPHNHALRPSEAQRLQSADMVIWLGPDLSPWLAEAIHEMAPNAASLPLLKAEGTTLLAQRGAHHHDHDHGDEEHAHEEEHDDHDHEGHDHEEHADDDHEGEERHDTHAWLSPDNAVVWLAVIAEDLAKKDPANAEAYRANAAEAAKAITAQSAEIEARLKPLSEREFLTAHDAYQYFEVRFGLTSHAAITDSEDQDAGPAHLREVLENSPGLGCFVTETTTSPATIKLVSETLDIPHVVIDPLGRDIPLGADNYSALLNNFADGFEKCLTPR
ncbi:zinc ABC transporter substrate-binding protein [Lentibacter algarum]|uniref:zinc ABC transporter substrate-binding protein n=1 Tax=Lentibacter algarum TaxID=576131 RepID=UPI001C076207|nr:zinc ABC transporter substrate-binding protein [Lentibacter algarum]MBU2981591.1 zinc ABC transporter substrate-binding protein [Lentibacter algarum]